LSRAGQTGERPAGGLRSYRLTAEPDSISDRNEVNSLSFSEGIRPAGKTALTSIGGKA
jgi:hypothetical protein